MKKIRLQVLNPIWQYIHDQSYAQTTKQIWWQIDAQVWNPINTQIVEIEDSLATMIWIQLKDQGKNE